MHSTGDDANIVVAVVAVDACIGVVEAEYMS